MELDLYDKQFGKDAIHDVKRGLWLSDCPLIQRLKV